MPLREDLLQPIEGDNPSGANLRYAPVYDKIKEARRQEDDAPQGDWQRERKTADFKLVVKLAGDELAAKSKDLQLAAWLTEALLHMEGFSGLRQGLDLLRGLLEGFWDTLYPEAEDGDLELRAAPLEWVGTRLEDMVRKTPITRGGLGYYKYKESRAVGTEDDAAQSEQKRQARETAIAEGKVTVEDFEKDSASTPTPQYEAWVAALDGCLASIESLAPLCESKFGESAPSFTPLRTAVEEVRHLTNQILQRRLEQEGRAPAREAAEPEAEIAPYEEAAEAGAAGAPARRRKAASGMDPEDLEDASERLGAVARFLRQQDSSSPAAYLLLRGYRWGELRGYGDPPDPAMLMPPSSQVRQNIRRLSLEANWSELAEAAEAAMAQPCGRAWLDLQRYAVRAAEENGYGHVATAIRSELRALLSDLPRLPEWTLMDDTPSANAETQAWLKELVGEASRSSGAAEESVLHMMETTEPDPVPAGEPVPADTYTLAMEAVRAGRPSEAIQLLADDIPRQRSGRTRFHRRLQLAQVCMLSGHEELAHPILEGIAEAIDEHKLEDWEAPDVVANPLSLLYRCLAKLDGNPEVKHKLYARISRLDPVQALECGR